MFPFLLDIDLMPINIVIYRRENDDFTFVAFNKSAEKTENLSRDKLLGCKLTEIFPAVKDFGLYDVLLRVYHSGKSEVYENSFYQDNRISGWRQNHIIKLPDNTIAAIYKDNTLEKEHEEYRNQLEEELSEIKESIYYQKALENSEEKLKAIIENSQDWVWEINQKGIYTYSSPIAEKLLGYSNAEIIGKTPFDFMSAEEASRVSSIFKEYMDKKISFTGLENINTHKDGSKVVMLSSGVPIINDSGELMGYRGLAHNISLEKKISHDLQLQKEEAERANAAKSDFLSSMSHELRTPMNAILGFSQLLSMNAEKNLTDLQQANIKQISDAGDHLLSLINEILDLSKIESNQFSLSEDSIVLHTVINEVLLLIIPLAEKRGIRIELMSNGKVVNQTEDECCCKKIRLTVDRTRFKQVIINILSNAIKYNKENGSILINCEQKKDKLLFIQISDTGKGLTKEQQSKLFEPFERFEAESHHIEGTGLGLVISKKLVNLMGGNIGVESTPNQGCTFWLEFPCYQNADVPKLEESTNSEIKETLIPQNEQKYSILCIEDNPTNLKLLQQTLSTIPDLIVLDASEALLGIELAIVHQPDLILMDINLPGMSGTAALQKIQQNKETSHIPVIAISANAMSKDIEKGLELGFTEYITKPIDVIKLLEAVDRNIH